MSASIKLDDKGNCTLCNKVSGPNEHVECFICKHYFHAVCSRTGSEDKVATKTTVANFLLGSTKKNFMFLCDICLTNFERNNADTDSHRINTLENKLNSMDSQLGEIKKLLSSKETMATSNYNDQPKHNQKLNNIWFDSDKLERVKAPSPPSVLVLGKTNDANMDKEHQETVQKAIMENNINLQDTYTNKEGELVLVCGSQESRDNLNTIVSNTNGAIPTKTPNGKRPTVTIVGLTKQYNQEEIVEMLVKQNDFIKRFAMVNNIGDHFKVLAIKPTRKNEQKFQVFAGVSSILRDGIKQFKDKITLGLTSCKVYDQYHVKRCNKCQLFGHYNKDCTSYEEFCAKCAGNHATNTCSSATKKCINCVRGEIATQDHFAYDTNCPCILKQQDQLKRSVSKSNLNVPRFRIFQTT